MDHQTATDLVSNLVAARSSTNDYFIDLVMENTDSVTDFHQWLENQLVLAGFLIYRRQSNVRIYLLVTEWPGQSDDIYFVIYPENKSGTLVEMHDVVADGEIQSLRWTYSPKKQDGRNEERKAYFAKNFLGTNVRVNLPTSPDSTVRFLDDIFDLVESRLSADELRADAPKPREAFPEGKEVYRMHKSRERNSKLVARLKDMTLAQAGHLACEACGFDFVATYGDLGSGYMEAHHLVPLSDLKAETLTTPDDLALLCANCHRMVHRVRPWLSRNELSQLLKPQKA